MRWAFYIHKNKVGEQMTIEERVSEEVKGKLNAHRKKEVLTKEDLDELMGISRQTYKKVKGRVRSNG